MARRLFHYQRYVEAHFVSPCLIERSSSPVRTVSTTRGIAGCVSGTRRPLRRETAFLVGLLTCTGSIRRPSVRQSARSLFSSFDRAQRELIAALRKMESGMYAEICRMYRVYCLTEKPELALMWGHYAGGHTGLCLEFDANSLPFGAATRVEYQKLYPAYDLVDVGYEPLVAKSIDWSYEAEWRLVAEEQRVARSADTVKTDSDFLTLPPGVLKSVTVGCLADAALRQSIRELVAARAPDVVVRQAAIAPDTYEIRITPPFSP